MYVASLMHLWLQLHNASRFICKEQNNWYTLVKQLKIGIMTIFRNVKTTGLFFTGRQLETISNSSIWIKTLLKLAKGLQLISTWTGMLHLRATRMFRGTCTGFCLTSHQATICSSHCLHWDQPFSILSMITRTWTSVSWRTTLFG